MGNNADDNIETLDSVIILSDGSSSTKEITVLKEHELKLTVNERPAAKIICTKEHLEELVTGRLLTEGFINKAADIKKMWFCKYETEVSVFLDDRIEFEELIREEKSCCTGNRSFLGMTGRKEPQKIDAAKWEPEWIRAMASRFKEGMKLHDSTQGTHSCILAKGDEILFECEDIGRHNAVDKAVGYALMNGIALSECILYTSGRVPVDMVSKVISAGIGVLASKSVPTAEAVDLAKEYGLTLICRAHTDSMQVMNDASSRF